jgi:hypothetical protein
LIHRLKTIQKTTRIECRNERVRQDDETDKTVFQEESIQLALRSKLIDQTDEDLGIPISTLLAWVHWLSKKQHPPKKCMIAGVWI